MNQKKFLATGLATLLIASLLLAPVSPSFAHGNVDQSFEGAFVAPGGSSVEAFGQSFTPTADNLIGVDIFFFSVSLDRNITIEIREGSFDGTLLGSSTKLVLAGSDIIEHFDFSLISLTPGNTYVIRTAASSGEFLWLLAPNTYPGGQALGGLGAPCPDCDFGFRTYFGTPDIDIDGIFNSIDTQPDTFSSDFSNVPLGGTTEGTVLSVTGSFELFNSLSHIPGVEYVDPPAPGDNVQISACSGAMILTASDDDNFVMTCGSATLQVLTGPVEEILTGSDGSTASATIGTGSTLTFYPDTFTFSTPSSNTDTIIITKDGLQFPLPPNSNIKPVNIDVKPGENNPATINLKIEKIITVAILGDVYLDVGQIDRTLSTLKFGDSLSATPATATKTSLKDVNLDGRMDLVSQFKLSQTNLSLGDTMGCIKGKMKQTFGGATIEGCDAVRLITK